MYSFDLVSFIVDRIRPPRTRIPNAVLSVTVLFLLCAVAANAQVTTADLVGTVTDHTGAVLPGAKVTVTNLSTNLTRTIVTDEAGGYVFNLLPVGSYSVRVEASGFKSFIFDRITPAAGDRMRRDVKMEVGETWEAVNITVRIQWSTTI